MNWYRFRLPLKVSTSRQECQEENLAGYQQADFLKILDGDGTIDYWDEMVWGRWGLLLQQ